MTNLEDYLSPFVNMTHFLIAIFVIIRLRSNLLRHHNDNTVQIQSAILALTNVNLSFQQTAAFVNKISSYSDHYPVIFFENYENLKKELISKAFQQQKADLTLVSPVQHCQSCGANDSQWFLFSNPPFCKKSTVYRIDSIETALLNVKQCKHCDAYHFISYFIDPKTEQKVFFNDLSNSQYFHFTQESIFEIRLIYKLLSDMMCMQCSFRGFTDSYNNVNAKYDKHFIALDRKRLTECFYAFHLVKYFSEFKSDHRVRDISKASNRSELDQTIDDIIPTLTKNFTQKWSKHEHPIPDPLCGLTLTIDGNWKLTRAKCCFDSIFIRIREFGKLITGCRRTPNINSYFCKEHQGKDLIFRAGGNKKVCFHPNRITVTKKNPREVIEEVYDSCLTIHDEELFLVRTNMNPLKWVNRDKITKEQYEKLRNHNKTGGCNTDKEAVYSCCIKCKTRGVVLAASNCGLIYSYREIFRSEGLRQVGNFYLDTVNNFQIPVPKFLVYDNGCQLMRHMKKKAKTNPSPRFDKVKHVKYVVDRLHIKGHKQKWCLKKCHPDIFPELKGTNTVVCEQINFWLGRFKHIMKHMNLTAFHFFLYIILNEYNRLKLSGHFNTTNKFKTVILMSKKRKFVEIDSENDDL